VDDILSKIVPNFTNPNPNPFQAPLLASNAPMPTPPPGPPPLSQLSPDDEDKDTDQEVSANESLAKKLTAKPAPAIAPPAQDPSAQPSDAKIGGMGIDDLKQALDQYQSQKRKATMIGALGDLLANRQSAGGILLHQPAPKNDVSGAIQESMPNPFQNKVALLGAYAQIRKNSGMYTQKDLDELNNKRVALGLNPVSIDQVNQPGGVKDYAVDPSSLKAKTAEIMADMNKSRADYYGTMGGAKVDQLAAGAGKDIQDDSIIKPLVNSSNSLVRSMSILNNPNKPVTTKDLNLAYNDYINAVAAGGAATEGKINRELPDTWAQDFNLLKQKAGVNDDLRQSPAGQQLISMLKENINTVNGDISGAVAARAKSKLDTARAAYKNNPSALEAATQAAAPYLSGKFAQSSQPQFGDDVLNYAKTHNISPEQAQAIKNQRTGGQ
jgi:hypothetical protein